ncbi:MAG: hypothetical protein QNJ63_04935 [Calothrix sp. MO_192.B10]|nr:hypothetical protein [Calothrix sp. MO_192.B10]
MRNHKAHLWDNPPPKKVSICGAIGTNTKTGNSTTQQQVPKGRDSCSESLQMLLNQRPSILVYLVLLTSTFFLTTLMIWVWQGRIVEVARIRGTILSSIDSAKYPEVLEDNSVSLKTPENQQMNLVNFIEPHILLQTKLSQEEALFFQEEMPLKIKVDNYQLTKSMIIDGKIKSIFPDSGSDTKNSFFYQVEVALEHNYPMNEQEYMALRSGQKVTAQIRRSYSIAEMLLREIN